jgi:outer membrane protein assembly factor BamB
MLRRLSTCLTVWLALIGSETFVRAQLPQPAAQAPRRPPRAARPSPATADIGLVPVLEVALDAQPSAPAAFDAAAAYVPLQGGRLVAVDFTTGKLRWTSEMSTQWAPSVSQDVVVVAGDEMLTALDAVTGRPRWHLPVPGGFSAPPIADTGWVVAAPASGHVIALRARDGEVLWTRQVSAPVRARPVVAAHGVYVSLADGHVAALELDTGAQRWATTLGGAPGDLLVLDEYLFVGADDKWFYSLRTRDGDQRWKQRIGGRPVGAAAVDTRRVYYVALDNILYAFDRGGGSRKWHQPLPVRPSGGPLVITNLVLVPAVAAEVYAYEVASGTPSGRAVYDADLAAPPQLVPGAVPGLTSIALITRTGVFTMLARRIEPAATPMPYPLGVEIPLSAIATPP